MTTTSTADAQATAKPGPRPIQRDWVSRTLGGTLLGFTMAIGCSGLLTVVLAAADVALGTRAQLAMWLVPPVWLSVLGACFMFASGLRTWLWLGLANLVVFGAYFIARFF
ncbi:hypothetical protein ACFONG_19120 [Uliginosibacterium paludis]|uniref:DUF3649 domain-containing protein n=1 Tax=Uliginosibacterium paludis TaxID=1615952 RepID=A0ABV2CU65_9RHOO